MTAPTSREEALARRQERVLERLADLEFSACGAPYAPVGASRAEKLEIRQNHLLWRLQHLEECLDNGSWQASGSSGPPPLPDDASDVHRRLHTELVGKGVNSFRFYRAPEGYYKMSLEERKVLLGAEHTDQLCKSIVMENKAAMDSVVDCSDPKNSKWYCIIVQYNARLDAEKVRSFVHALNEGKVAKRRFNMQLAKGDDNDRLTGYSHNAVSPVGMATAIPMIMSHRIAELAYEGGFFWMGGGEVDLKLGMEAKDFIDAYEPWVADITHPAD